MTAIIQTDALTKRFRKVCALDQLTLDVPEGAVYALVGPNGAGKTTGIKVLMNLIAATSGRAEVLGVDTKQIRGKSYTQIGYVSENQDIPEWMKVVNQAIRTSARSQNQSPFPRHEDETRACERSGFSSQADCPR